MFCPSCGSQCADDAQFCPDCGCSLAQTQPEQINSDSFGTDPGCNSNPNYSSIPSSNPNPGYNANPVNPAPKKNSTVVLVLGIVATVINSGLGCLCGCLGSIPGIVCAIIGLVLGFKAKKQYAPGEKDKKNDIGVILCFVSLGIVVLTSILNAIIGAGLAMADYY